MAKLDGVVPALTTPFREDQSLDLEGLARLVDLVIEDGVDGVLVNGCTGESWALYALDLGRIMSKYVGETERQIRLIFQRAREKSEEGIPVIIFFDEMESLFRTRGSGISSDIESTIVPRRLAGLSGSATLNGNHLLPLNHE